MEKCKFCEAELEENSTVCPSCGKDNAECIEAEAVTEAAAAEETAQAAQTAEAAEAPAKDAAESSAEETADAPTDETAVSPAVEAAPAEKKPTAAKIALAVTALVVIAAVLIAILFGSMQKQEAPEESSDEEIVQETVEATIPADTNANDVTFRGTYYAADEDVLAGRNTVVATMGSRTLTNSQLQVYYWMQVRSFLNQYGSYASYFGLDGTQSLDTQACGLVDEGEHRTWHQFFLEGALASWQNYQSMAAAAEDADFELTEEYADLLSALESDLDSSAKENGYESAASLLHQSLGPAAEVSDYVHYMHVYYTGYAYYRDHVNQFDPSEEELEDYYNARRDAYEENGLTEDSLYANVRHILITPDAAEEGSEEETAAWAAAEAKAQDILDTWLAGDMSETSFADLANEHSTDPGSNTKGGLYENVYVGQMVPEFNDWCFDAERQAGDYGIVKTTYGYHIMYFCGSTLMWPETARADMQEEDSQTFMQGISDAYPMEVDYSKILICNVKLA